MEIIYKKDGIEVDGNFISLEEIIKNVNETKVTEDELCMLEITWDGNRGFDGCYEQVVLPKKNVDRVVELIRGKYIYFGEIAGKHSEVYGDINNDDITIVFDAETIQNFLKRNPSGHDADHSFLDNLDSGLEHETITQEEIDELNKLIWP